MMNSNRALAMVALGALVAGTAMPADVVGDEVDFRSNVSFGRPASPCIGVWSRLSFESTTPGAPETSMFLIKNTGVVPLCIDRIRPDVEWLTVDPGQVKLRPFEDRMVRVTARAPAPGQYDARLFVLSDDPEHPAVVVPVRVHVSNKCDSVVDN